MKQKRDEKGRFEKKEKKCKEELSCSTTNLDFGVGVAFGITLCVAIVFVAFACGTWVTPEIKTITISDKMLKNTGDYSTIITCDDSMFWANYVMYSKLKVGHTYTVKTYKAPVWTRPEITEIITNNDPPATECSG